MSRDAQQAVAHQEKWFNYLIRKGRQTDFGKAHNFDAIYNYSDFSEAVPVRDYEELKPFVERVVAGEKNVLWPGRPKYFAKTSGTTSGVKYIPITKESVPNHIQSTRNALFNYAYLKNDFSFFDGKVIFFSGSPVLENKNTIPFGRLSGIVNHEVPFWLKGNQLPTFKTNCIEDWSEKVKAIIQETKSADLRLIGGIPPWVQDYFEQVLEETGTKNIKTLFPNFSLFVFGGVNYEPYRQTLTRLIGGDVGTLELYPASEGFIAYQDRVENEGLLLNTNSGIYFEFIPLDEIGKEQARRLNLAEVQKGEQYALILSSNAGLWAYNIGDLVEFVSLDPYRIRVTGRIKHFISAFGEHVIGKEVEEAMNFALKSCKGSVREFTVAPKIEAGNGKSRHQWLVEFDEEPKDLTVFAEKIDESMRKQNLYYDDLRRGDMLTPLELICLSHDSFVQYMKSIGKHGGQNKVPRLANDRKLADAILSKKV